MNISNTACNGSNYFSVNGGVEFFNVNSVVEDFAFGRVVKTHYKVYKRRFSASRMSDYADHFALLNFKIYVL